MSTLVLNWNTPASLYEPTASADKSDRTLRDVLDGFRQSVHEAASSAQSLALTSLFQLIQECSQPGWDGHGARVLSERTVLRAKAFLDALPASLSSPDIVPEPDGEIAIDWYFGPNQQLSISVGESGPLHFAGVIGEAYGQPRVRHGKEPFEGVVAGDLLRYIHELHELAGVTGRRRAA